MSLDLDALMNAPIEGPMSTERPICPEGEYTAIIDEPSPDKGVRGWIRSGTIEKGERAGQSFVSVGVPFVVLDQKVKDQMKQQKVVVPGDQFLDLDNGRVSTKKGENVLLGQIREALGINKDNFAGLEPMLLTMAGKGPVKIIVKHQTRDGGTFAKVTRVAKTA